MSSLATDDMTATADPGGRATALFRGDASCGDPLADVGKWLLGAGYVFVCPPPESHARVNARPQNAEARGLADVFGWSRPFHRGLLPAPVLERLHEADVVREQGALLRCQMRFSTLGRRPFVHSAFPTTARDAVFFGPDTYRFLSFVGRELESPWACPVETLIDIGCGTGAGAIEAICVQADGLGESAGLFDLIVSNPLYMIDPARRTYCHGGAGGGIELALRFLQEGLAHLSLGGRLLLYTGTPVVEGQDLFQHAAQETLDAAQVQYEYVELDPDVFGEDLARPEYVAVDRIAVVGLVARRPGGPR